MISLTNIFSKTNQHISFPNHADENIVRQVIGKPSGQITKLDLINFRSISDKVGISTSGILHDNKKRYLNSTTVEKWEKCLSIDQVDNYPNIKIYCYLFNQENENNKITPEEVFDSIISSNISTESALLKNFMSWDKTLGIDLMIRIDSKYNLFRNKQIEEGNKIPQFEELSVEQVLEFDEYGTVTVDGRKYE